jgi:hypothetical protein
MHEGGSGVDRGNPPEDQCGLGADHPQGSKRIGVLPLGAILDPLSATPAKNEARRNVAKLSAQVPVRVHAEDVLAPKPSALKPISGSDSGQFSDYLLNTVGAALWFPEGTSAATRAERVTAAMAALYGFGPKDAAEGMMAAQAVALHHAAMECFRRAVLPGQSAEVADRLRRQAANLSRAMVDMAEAIDRRRGKGPQVVRVERVVVHEGGQAIVGAVTPGRISAPGGGAQDGS